VQFGSGAGDRGDDALLPPGQVGRHPGGQPRSAAAEQADAVEPSSKRSLASSPLSAAVTLATSQVRSTA
jgi:hypothetical protein